SAAFIATLGQHPASAVGATLTNSSLGSAARGDLSLAHSGLGNHEELRRQQRENQASQMLPTGRFTEQVFSTTERDVVSLANGWETLGAEVLDHLAANLLARVI